MGKHARLSPSNPRWVHCPGSVREEQNYENIPSSASIDGTGSHLLLETCLKNKEKNLHLSVNDYLGKYIGINHEDKENGWEIKQDRIDRVKHALNYIQRRVEELKIEFHYADVKVFTEVKVNPGSLYDRDDWFGTTDVVIKVISGKVLIFCEVIDYKDGRIYVDEKNNSQLISYLIGAVFNFNMTMLKNLPCRMTIIQPKTNTPIRYHNSIFSDVLEQGRLLSLVAKLTDSEHALLIPDEMNGKGYCRWCKHRDKCEARRNQTTERLGKTMNDTNSSKSSPLFDIINQTFKDITKMDNETLSQMLDIRSTIEDIFKQAEEEAEIRLTNGQELPGYVLKPGRATKKWNIEEEELVKKLKSCKLKKDEFYISKLITPSQVLKLEKLTKLQKKRFADNYIEEVPGKLRLTENRVKDDTLSGVDMFKDVVEQCSTKSNKISFI